MHLSSPPLVFSLDHLESLKHKDNIICYVFFYQREPGQVLELEMEHSGESDTSSAPGQD